MSVLDEAFRLWDAGYNVLPLKLDGTKAPGFRRQPIRWKWYKDYRAGREQIRGWFWHGQAGIGIIGGRTSGGLEALDFDRHDQSDPDTFPEFVDACPVELFKRLVVYRSPGGGWRACWRCAECLARPKQELAHHASGKVAIELRAEQINVVPGGNPDCHRTGKPYRYLRGHLADCATIAPDERTILLAAAQGLNKLKIAPKVRKEAHQPTIDPEADWFPWQDFDRRGGWDWLEEAGWVREGTNGWRRPGKSEGISATTDHYDGMFYLFSSSVAGMESDRGYSRSAAYAYLIHDGDFASANKELARLRYGRASQSESELNTRVAEILNTKKGLTYVI